MKKLLFLLIIPSITLAQTYNITNDTYGSPNYGQTKTIRVEEKNSLNKMLIEGARDAAGGYVSPNVSPNTSPNTSNTPYIRVSGSSYTPSREIKATPSEEIKVPLSIDFSKYSTIALVSVKHFYYEGTNNKKAMKLIQEGFNTSPLNVITAISFNKKQWKKNPTYLKNVKNKDWLYVYYDKLNRSTRTLMVRDYTNKILYSVKQTNMPFVDLVYPLIAAE